MKKSKKILSGVMAVCLMGSMSVIPESIAPVVSMTASAEIVASFTFSDNLTYTRDNEGTVTISGTGEMGDYFYNTPWQMAIPAITKLIIEDGVTDIGADTFRECVNLTSISIPESVTKIYINAFMGCSSLESVTIPDNVTMIGEYAFSGCSALKEITILNPECEIDDSKNTIDETATIYGYENSTAQAYAEKYNRKFVALNEKNVIISGTFGENISYVLDSEGTLTISGTGKMLDVGRGTTEISPWDSKKSLIKKLIIEDGVTNISSEYLFEDCTNLTSVSIPDSVTSIGSFAFCGCDSLESITIPNGVKSIDWGLFSGCGNLKEVILPENLTHIGINAFSGCISLENITIPESVTEIATGAFYNTPWLKARQTENPLVIVNNILIDSETCSGDVVIPDNVKNISMGDQGYSAFGYNSNITSITFPATIKNMYDFLSTLSSLKELTFLNPEFDFYGFGNNKNIQTIYGYENSTAQAYAEEYGYNFESLGEAPSIPLGNVNNDEYIDAIDATAILVEYAGLSTSGETTFSYAQKKAGDVNSDGLVDAVDATLILNYYAKVSTGNTITLPDFIAENN